MRIMKMNILIWMKKIKDLDNKETYDRIDQEEIDELLAEPGKVTIENQTGMCEQVDNNDNDNDQRSEDSRQEGDIIVLDTDEAIEDI